MEEKTTMDDFKEELEASFQDTQENDVADITDPAWQTLVQYLEDKTVLTVKIGGIVKSLSLIHICVSSRFPDHFFHFIP